MRVLFWGTPDFAVPSLLALGEEGYEIVGVITRPDRPAGRGRKVRPSAVRELARMESHPVLTPERPRGEGFLDDIRRLEPDLSVVAAYGHILPRDVLDVPRLGSINVHASLLPELRGAAPVNWAIIRGHERSGVTIMRMVEAMDAGPILLQRGVPIGPRDTATDLYTQLSELGAATLIEALALLQAGGLEEREQDHSLATYAPKLDRSAARLDWGGSAPEIANRIRGLDMTPGAWSELEGQPVKLFAPEPVEERSRGEPPGTVLPGSGEEGLLVAAGTGAVWIREVQPPGKRRMSAAEWLRGAGPEPGRRFE